ncbi:MAG: hypothetical protein UY96_C0003G0084 [Parcubacteria group bacterium GW2011_GWB1_56_8]|nr:MAG: hypothetical protein UY96_C0003G0084 [Parcubacteria group bacterium GW2011_GWB1_56_8]
MAIRLIGTCDKRTYGVTRKSRKTEYRAKLGNVESNARSSEKEAFDDLSVQIATLCGELTGPTIMFDLVEPQTVWVAYAGAFGWSYEIHRHASWGISRGSSIGGSWTRDECLSRMREHWYSNNVAPIVNGIVALCTSRREWICPKCHYVMRSEAPYVCQAPRCGHEARA